jgi:tRNA pseudouridine32 synthase / 23S rRNA pseudouridine746 synthase
LSAKKPKKKQGLVKGDMLPARRGAWKLTNSLNNPAITQFFSCGLGQGRRLFLIKPLSGKTHQIRVALKSVGAPILGDCLYGDKRAEQVLDRTYLHAFSIAFHLYGQTFRFQALPREGVAFATAEVMAAFAGYAAPWLQAWPSVVAQAQVESVNDAD